MAGADTIARDLAGAADRGLFRTMWSGLVRGLKGGSKEDAAPIIRDGVTITRQAMSKIRATPEAIRQAFSADGAAPGRQIQIDRVLTPEQKESITSIHNLILMESRVNDQRYAGTKAISFPADYKWTPAKGPYRQLWAMMPVDDVKIFTKGDQVTLPSHLQGIIRDVEVAGKRGPEKQKFAFFPIHWQQKDIVGKEYPLVEEGLAHVSASVRVVYMDPTSPMALGDFSHTNIKMHLDDVKGSETPINGGLGGHRRIDAVWAEMSPTITGLMEKMIKEQKFSPLVDVMPEAVTMVDKNNRGVIFRTVPEGEVFPAFSLYSPVPKEAKDGLKLAALGGKAPSTDILAVDLLENLRQKNPGLSKMDAIRELFVDPVLDVVMSMAKEGMALELHPQNFMFRFDPATGKVKNIVCRDLHGFNYSADYRAKKGLPDLLAPESLKQMGFPHLKQETVKAYFEKDGKVRDRFKSPAVFENTFDFFSSMWYFHTLDSLEKAGYITHSDALQAAEMIKDRLEFFAGKYKFDLSQLNQPTKQYEFTADPATGIRHKILFRRAVQK